ncbi:MAG TPA: T9SS type A sorting domain-containing protein [Ignavibacteriaceae bacterium]|nr:T9SS type A sorting domain-containing protein [Ignavibacteriaceae bacterium]
MNKLRIILMILLLAQGAFGTIRYVSKTGSSTPPYITWETASDSIQKCLDICIDGDTVIVANGVYKESLIINPALTLIGSSMDSCVIDGRGLALITISLEDHGYISGIHIIGRGKENMNFKGVLCGDFKNLDVMNCRISNCYDGIYFTKSSGEIKNVIMQEIVSGVFTFCMSDTCKPKLYNSLLVLDAELGKYAWTSFDGGEPTIENNIMVGKIRDGFGAPKGITTGFRDHKKIIVKNNLMSGFLYCIPENDGTDSGIVINNIMTENYQEWGVIFYPNNKIKIRNNIFSKSDYAILTNVQPNINHNLFWENNQNISSPFSLGSEDIIANPMFVKDTMGYSLKGDYHLQKYSPGIDAGDPTILDKDGSRSDIGLYGGPGGEVYQYLDLPPLTPRNIKYTANINEKKIIFSWKKNSESDFKEYQVFRDTVQGFTPDSVHLYLILPDSTLGDTAQFIDTYSGENAKYYYRIIATDNQENESEPSDEISVIITGVDIMDVEIATDYRLYQNYPNPFNPNTVIGYQLAVGSYVKVMVYDIKGELLEVLVNENKPAGYYEVEFNAGKYASGIYLYRIEAVDESGIPRFMDMKKMMLVK